MLNGSFKQMDIALFDAASLIDDASERLAFLTQACGENTSQLARITAWLDARNEADEFFRVAAIDRAEVSQDFGNQLDASPDPAGRMEISLAPETEEPGSWLGRYHLIERIGEGGSGVVYLARQTEPVQRRVALKIIRFGLDAESVIARFAVERQALALMDHPNIVHVLDAGTTENGRPYFVMQWVHGERITGYCDGRYLSVPQRLDLFIQVCQAIQHAHQKGVIHRDIKPSNILVSWQDGHPVPKVIDFGIARAMERIADKAASCEQFIGTPAYMSPEQAEGASDFDTRSDIYSMGVLLHELLTGRTPFDSNRLNQASLLEMMRILREEEPSPPSVMLAKLCPEELAAAAAARNCKPGALISAVRGDLDGIVLKAISKDRRNRYETVTDLAMDIRRYLDDEPVSARSPGRFYLFRKLVRRNKIAFSAAAAVILSLVAGIALASWFYLREREAHQTQAHLREMAEAARANESRLLQQSKARESISLAAMLLAEGKITEADALLDKTPLNTINPSLEAAHVFRSLGDWNAIRQRWQQAANCYLFYLQANRLGNILPPDGFLVLIAIAPTLVEAGKLDDYSRFRLEIIERYHNVSNPIDVSTLLKACLLTPADETVLKRLRPQAETLKSILSTKNHPQSMDAYQSAFSALTLGMMAYRSGDFSGTAEWSRKCLAYPNENQSRAATAHSLLAMALWRLGQQETSRAELKLSREFFAAPFSRDVYFPRGKGQGHWLDWAIAHLLEREASAMMESGGNSAR